MIQPTDQADAELEPLREQALAWVRKLTSGSATRADAERFRHWCEADPRHRAAFAEARAQWALLKPALGQMLREDAGVAGYHRRTLRTGPTTRRAFLGALVGMGAAAGVAAYVAPGLLPGLDGWGADYRTAAGEQLAVALEGEASAYLNTRTRVRRLAAHDGMTGLELLDGETMVEVPASRRLFGVTAGVGRVTTEAGRFEVRHLAGRSCVTCVEGEILVTHPAGKRVLQAAQQTVYNQQSISSIAAIDPMDALAWRRGEMVFRQASLDMVVAEINRYRPGRVVLMDSVPRGKTLSARFKLAELDKALLQLQHSFGLTARALPGGLLLLS